MDDEYECKTDVQLILSKVMKHMETSGVVNEFKAQIRANVFHLMDTKSELKPSKLTTKSANRMHEYMKTSDGRNSMLLVLDFLDTMKLMSTMKVALPEANMDTSFKIKRRSLASQLDIVIDDHDPERTKLPLIHELLLKQKKTYGRMDSIEETSDLSEVHLNNARDKFNEYDMDNNGTIDKDELRKLFSDMFPDFHRNMLERYVTDEFRAADKDFSNTIDFTEFLTMYRRLFILCKTVVSNDVVDLVSTAASPRSESPSISQRSKIPKLKKKVKVEKKRVSEYAKPRNLEADLDEFSFEYDTKDRSLKSLENLDLHSSAENSASKTSDGFKRRSTAPGSAVASDRDSNAISNSYDDDDDDDDDTFNDSSTNFTSTQMNSKSYNTDEIAIYSEDELTTDKTVSLADHIDYEESIN